MIIMINIFLLMYILKLVEDSYWSKVAEAQELYLGFKEFFFSSPPGAVNFYGPSLLRYCHP